MWRWNESVIHIDAIMITPSSGQMTDRAPGIQGA
jgi:hypothetical protein